MDVMGLVGTISAAVAASAALPTVYFAQRGLVAGKDTTKRLEGVSEHLRAAVEAIERVRLADRLRQRLDQYERISGAIHGLAWVYSPVSDEEGRRIRLGAHGFAVRPARDRMRAAIEAQATMRAALAVIPGATGEAGSLLHHCFQFAYRPIDVDGRPQYNITAARIEIENEIRKVHEQLKEIVPLDGEVTAHSAVTATPTTVK
jgi:hypothetical protein